MNFVILLDFKKPYYTTKKTFNAVSTNLSVLSECIDTLAYNIFENIYTILSSHVYFLGFLIYNTVNIMLSRRLG